MNRRSLLLLLLIGILLAACVPSGAGGPTPDVNATIGAVAETLAVAVFQTQTALAPAATNTALPTVTSLATSTPLTLSSPTTFVQQPVFVAATATPTGTFYTATPLSSSLGAGCNNLRLINSYTNPAGPFVAGQKFTQSWQVENSGTCEWLYLYELVFVSGDRLGEDGSQRLSNKIPPGKWTTFTINLVAPDKSGKYSASWRFSDGAGTVFGATLPVSITVGGSTSTPKPDSAATAAAAAQQTVDAAVASTLTAQASITPTP